MNKIIKRLSELESRIPEHLKKSKAEQQAKIDSIPVEKDLRWATNSQPENFLPTWFLAGHETDACIFERFTSGEWKRVSKKEFLLQSDRNDEGKKRWMWSKRADITKRYLELIDRTDFEHTGV